MRDVLLLTSTIRPRPDQPQLKVVDPAQRLQDYRRGLCVANRYLDRGTVDAVVFADNSGHDLADLREPFASRRIEWISFYDLDYDISFHRGYGEFRLIDRAWRESRTLATLPRTARVWKMTGRYYVRNLPAILALTPREIDLCCDVRGSWAEMSFMAWSPRGYRLHIEGLWKHLATQKVPELVLAERLKTAEPMRSRIVTSMYWPPVVIGRRGTDGTPYQGRFTPVKLVLMAAWKSLQWPLRRLAHALRPAVTGEVPTSAPASPSRPTSDSTRLDS